MRGQMHTLGLNSGRATNQLCKLRLALSASPGQQCEGVRVSACFWKHSKNVDGCQGLLSLPWRRAIWRHLEQARAQAAPLTWELKLRFFPISFSWPMREAGRNHWLGWRREPLAFSVLWGENWEGAEITEQLWSAVALGRLCTFQLGRRHTITLQPTAGI